MKRIYKQPAIKVATLRTEGMICASKEVGINIGQEANEGETAWGKEDNSGEGFGW